AIGAAVRPDVEVVVTRNPISGRPTTLFETLLVPTPPGAADATHGSVSPDSIAKLLFTSGSTGAPKAVINTQRMWCSNQAMILSQLAFFADEPPVIVDWSPWHHTAVPGVELKLVPREGKLEARLRGPNIMPGYWRQHDLTVQAFDEDGFYKLGDALKFEDPPAPRAGLLSDGRVAEDFKLPSGTWVNVGPLRARLLAQLEPYARDVVIAGADRDEIGALIFPNLEACRTLAAAPAADVTGDTRVRDELRARLSAFARTSTGSSNPVGRALLLGEPPSLDASEMTDKGSINQRAVLERRADLVAELYAPEPSPRVLVIDEGS